MCSRRNQLPAAEVIRVPSIVDVDAPPEVTFPYLRDPRDDSRRTAMFGRGKFVIDEFEQDGVFRVDADLPARRLTHRDRW
jgi:hypothetical protein